MPRNVQNLKIAWRRPALDPGILEDHPGLKFSNNLRATPIMAGGILYSSNAVGLVEAMDPATGRTLWIQETPGGPLTQAEQQPRDRVLVGGRRGDDRA